MARKVSTIDTQLWICKLKKRNINEFEYRELPAILKDKGFLRRAKEEGLIESIRLSNDGRNLWRINDAKYKQFLNRLQNTIDKLNM